MIVRALLASAALIGAAGAAQASEVRIKDAVARVVVIPENRADIAVEVSGGGGRLPTLEVRRQGDDVIVDGGLDRRIQNCESRRDSIMSPAEPTADVRVDVRGIGEVPLTEAPLVTIRTPMDARVRAGGAVWGAVGRTNTLDLGSAGCGDWTVGNVQQRLSVSIAGSGDVAAGTSGELNVNIAGSGDVRTAATRSVEANIAGSGDLHVTSMDGSLDASIAGSGDVRVAGGRATTVSVAIAGSGDVILDGAAQSLNANIIGSGDVRVASAGSVTRRVMGSGDVIVGRR
ncbi:DUF2807 domain-containing protein [Brevundimonas sp. 2R-24]|uniref:DUF2807 domain-containing protein n=1 Tax=Peiella sedimenti TaxID=3061083 RepID=A0ABT8SNW8_9CAUL|nr:DUF2807 domain-containing protein [Caulobacteraceae bacterium XZ-24]